MQRLAFRRTVPRSSSQWHGAACRLSARTNPQTDDSARRCRRRSDRASLVRSARRPAVPRKQYGRSQIRRTLERRRRPRAIHVLSDLTATENDDRCLPCAIALLLPAFAFASVRTRPMASRSHGTSYSMCSCSGRLVRYQAAENITRQSGRTSRLSAKSPINSKEVPMRRCPIISGTVAPCLSASVKKLAARSRQASPSNANRFATKNP